MAYASGRGWQLQVAQKGERSSVLAWHHGERMLGYWEGHMLPELAHAFIEEAFAAAPVQLAERKQLLHGQQTGEDADTRRSN